MKGDGAGRRLSAERSRAGLDSEAFTLWVEFLERLVAGSKEVFNGVSQFFLNTRPGN